MHAVYMFSCKHSRTYDATAMAICMRRRARVRSVIRTGSSAANTPAAANCHPRARRLPFPRRNRYEIKTIEDLLVINGGNGKRSKAHAGKVGTGVLARIAVKQMRRDCAQCTFHTPTCLVEACSCRQNHRQSHQQTGWDSRRRCKRPARGGGWGRNAVGKGRLQTSRARWCMHILKCFIATLHANSFAQPLAAAISSA